MQEPARAAKRSRGRPSLDADRALDEAECLRAALDAFAEHGFEGTSVREVARTLNVSHGLLNAKFGSKRALWEAAVDFGMETLHASMSRLPSPEHENPDIVQRLRDACCNFLEGLMEVPALVRLMNVEGTARSDRLEHIAAKFFHRRIWPLQTLLREGQEAGIFREVPAAVPFTLLAHGAGALIALGPLMNAADVSLNHAPRSAIGNAKEAAEIIVRGLLR